MKADYAGLATDCRRLYLRNWRGPETTSASARLAVSVSIYVRYRDSSSAQDEFGDVVDYNIMRDALLDAGDPSGPDFLHLAFEALFRSPVVVAEIDIENQRTGAVMRAVRTAT